MKQGLRKLTLALGIASAVCGAVSCGPRQCLPDRQDRLPLRDAINVHQEFGFAWSLPDFKQQDDMKAVVRECIADHRNSGGRELEVFRMLADDRRRMVYLAFEADGVPDRMVVYAYDVRGKRLLFKFYMPMA